MALSHQFTRGAVVVGVDGSPESLRAVDLAAQEAVLRDAPLHIVYGLLVPYFVVVLTGPPPPPPADERRQHAEHVVTRAVARARDTAPAVDISGEVIMRPPAQALIDRSHAAALIVVGDRGLGSFTGLLMGSVAIHVADHATCPILVSRGATDPGLPILLAADGSPANDPAVGFAFHEAALRGVPLVALHVATHSTFSDAGDMRPRVHDDPAADGGDGGVLATALAGWKDRYPHVDVRPRVVHGRVRTTIIDATRGAQLAVVGARGHGGFTGMLLGSVSHAIVRHAACPTAIIPHRR